MTKPENEGVHMPGEPVEVRKPDDDPISAHIAQSEDKPAAAAESDDTKSKRKTSS